MLDGVDVMLGIPALGLRGNPEIAGLDMELEV